MKKYFTIVYVLLLACLAGGLFAQPIPIRQVPEGSRGAFSALGNYYFFDNDSLWRSDGTEAGTFIVRELGSKPSPYENVKAYVLNSVFFFKTQIGTTSRLWRSDGTYAGTSVVASYAGLDLLAVHGNEFYYSASQSGVWKLFKVTQGGAPVYIRNLHALKALVAGGDLFLDVQTNVERGLWKTDGTASGTVLLKAVEPRTMQSVNNLLLFTSGSTLWRSDGTTGGTVLVRDFGEGIITETGVFNNRLYIPIDARYELFVSDGSEEGTTLLQQDLGVDVTVFNFGVVNNQLFFNVDQQGPPTNLWRSDGTTGGTLRVHSMPGYIDPIDMTVSGNHLFYAMHTTGGYEPEENEYLQLWQSDLTNVNTKPVMDIFPGTTFPYSKNLENVNGELFFMSKEDGHLQLWKYDPNSPNTETPFFTVVNAETNQDTGWLQDGGTIAIYEGQGINIRFNPVISPGSVRFVLNSNVYRTENVAPFALAGDNSGDYNVWPAAEGHYTLVAQQYSEAQGGGTLLASSTIHFYVDIIKIPQPPVVDAGLDKSITFPTNTTTLNGTAYDPDGSITTINWTQVSGPQFVVIANPDSLITQVTYFTEPGTYWFRLSVTDNEGNIGFDEVAVEVSGISITTFILVNFTPGGGAYYIGVSGNYTLDLADYHHPYWNVLANQAGNVESVQFHYAEISRVENEPPFALFGDINGELNHGELKLGTHTLSAIPYPGNNATGAAGLPLSIQLTVVNSGARFASVSEKMGIADVYPNPTSDLVNIKINALQSGEALLEVYDLTGTLQEKLYEGYVDKGQSLQFLWETHKARPGLYIVKARVGQEEQVYKLMVK